MAPHFRRYDPGVREAWTDTPIAMVGRINGNSPCDKGCVQ